MVAEVVSIGTPAPRVPTPATPLLGRQRELREIAGLLADDATRIVTLLGPGGVGKTRLALAVAAKLEAENPGSVLYVPVAHERSREGMVAEIANALGVRDQPGATTLDSVAAALQNGINLLAVDNLEQIPDAGIDLATILAAVPELTLVATSRSPLRISGERQYRIDPLPVEAGDDEPAAVRLFIDRAKLVGPFEITATNRETVRAICRRLDGLPLAIELAAARIRTLSPDALLARISHRLTLLAGGPIDLPERQRALQATLAWSYDLLAEDDQRAFRLLSTIPAGFSLDLAAATLNQSEGQALTSIESLLNQSLLIAAGDDGEPRFGMLLIIRDFGLEQSTAEEQEIARTGLAKFFHTRAPEIRAGARGPEARERLNWCDRERANVKSAIAWLAERGNATQALELATAFFDYWYIRGSYREGIEIFELAIAHSDDAASTARARALNGLSGLYDRLDDYDRAAMALDQAKDLWEEANDSFGVMQAIGNRALIDKGQGNFGDAISGLERAIEMATAIGAEPTLARWESNLGTVYTSIGDHKRAAELQSRALARNRHLGRELETANVSRRLAMTMAALGNIDSAEPALEEARAVLERLGAQSDLAYCLNSMGTLKNQQGDIARSEDYHAQALALWTELGEPQGRAIALFHLGDRALTRGDLTTASERLRESLSLSRPIGEPRLISWALVGYAGLALKANQAERAARLNAYAQALAKRHGFQPDEAGDYRPRLRRSLGKARFDAAWKAGSTMSLDDALAEIEMITIANKGVSTSKPAASAPVPVSSVAPEDHGLTDRELDVLRLVAAGKTNVEIGEALFISPFTAKTHVANLLGKLGVESRAAASTWAAQHGLL